MVIFGVGAYLVNTGVVQFSFNPQLVLNGNIGDEASYDAYLTKLEDVPQNFGSITEFFVAVAEKEGGAYAFEILKRAPLPPDTDLHLLGHAVGDELYKQEGLDGMQYCTPDFRNACSHSIVVGALLEDGLGVFDRINDVCQKAPGGPGAYTMCFHGFGHGALAFSEFEVPDAIELCRKTGTEAYGQNEFHQCVGGVIMEMYQGVHDPVMWASKKDKYLDPKNPLKLCQSDFMPDEAKSFCYTYITPFIFDAAGAVNGNPTPDIYEKAFSYCENVKENNLRLVCYAGLGKEFIVLAQSRDIRNMDQTSDAQLEKVIGWCTLARVPDGIESCLLEVQNSLYWGGENDYHVSIRYCDLMPSKELGSACFDKLFENVNFYERDAAVKKEICTAVPQTYAKKCDATVQ